jgi:hypothetical protein
MQTGRLERQLLTIVSPERARVITSLAKGIEGTLESDPVYEAFLPHERFVAIAAVFGTYLRICTEVSEIPLVPGDTEGTASHAEALKTRSEMGQVVTVTDAPDPNPDRPVTSVLELLRSLANTMPTDQSTDSTVTEGTQDEIDALIEEVGVGQE